MLSAEVSSTTLPIFPHHAGAIAGAIAGAAAPSVRRGIATPLAAGSVASLAEKVHRRMRALPGIRRLPHAAEAEITAHDLAWVRRVGIVEGERDASKHAAIRCGSFAAHTYAGAPVEVAMLGANLISWLYLFDDRFGEGEAGESQAELRACFAEFERVARVGVLPAHAHAFHHALLDVVERGSLLGGGRWRDRFADSLAYYMEGCARELPYRRTRRIPGFEQYRRVKRMSVGAFPVFDLVELAHGQRTVRDAADAIVVSEARHAAALLCAWVNDVYSFPKEARDGDPLNLVQVLMYEHDLDVDAALDRAIELYVRDLVRFEALLARARARGASPATDAVLRGIERWVHGNRAWTGSCGRYQP